MQQPRQATLSPLASLAVLLAVIVAGGHPACAGDAASQNGPQILITPYLWLPGINTAINTLLPRAPEVNSSVGAFDLLGHLGGVPFMGSADGAGADRGGNPQDLRPMSANQGDVDAPGDQRFERGIRPPPCRS